nr:glycosyltransferase [Aeromicrobium wangtongii]
MERLSLRVITSRETHRVYLTGYGTPAPGTSVIKHCSYPVPIEGQRQNPTGVLGFFGSVLPYKGVERLLRVFITEVGNKDLRLAIAGQAPDPDYRRLLTELGQADFRVATVLRKLTEEELTEAIRNWDLVVLPYEKMYNSGAAMLALSHGRPILVPDTPSMRELRDDAGADWVITYPSLTGEVITDAAARAHELANNETRPDLSGRSPAVMGRQYLDLYRDLVS